MQETEAYCGRRKCVAGCVSGRGCLIGWLAGSSRCCPSRRPALVPACMPCMSPDRTTFVQQLQVRVQPHLASILSAMDLRRTIRSASAQSAAASWLLRSLQRQEWRTCRPCCWRPGSVRGRCHPAALNSWACTRLCSAAWHSWACTRLCSAAWYSWACTRPRCEWAAWKLRLCWAVCAWGPDESRHVRCCCPFWTASSHRSCWSRSPAQRRPAAPRMRQHVASLLIEGCRTFACL